MYPRGDPPQASPQVQQQPSPTISNPRQPLLTGAQIQRPLPTPSYPNPPSVQDSSGDRNISLPPPPQLLNYRNGEMTDEMLAEIERANMQQARSRLHPSMAGHPRDESAPPLKAESARVSEQTSPEVINISRRLRRQREQASRESPKAPQAYQQIPASFINPRVARGQLYPPEIHPEDLQYPKDPMSAFYQAYLRSSRPEAPIPPTPHSQTPAPSPSPMLSGMYGAGKDMPPFSPVRPVGSPYPYPFSHVRRNQSYSGPIPSTFDPNHPSKIQEQLARQWLAFAQNTAAGEHPGMYEAGKDIVRPNAPINPTPSPFLEIYEAGKDTPRVGSPYPYPFSHVRRPRISSAPPELEEPPSLLEAELEARRKAEAEHPLTRDARRTVKTPEVELEAGHEAEHAVREVESNMREVAGQEAAHGGVTCVAEREFTMEDHAPIDPSPLTQDTMIGDATSPPVDEYIPPVSSPSTAAGSGAFTNKPGNLPQPMMVVNPARSSPAISDLEPPVTVPVTAPPMPVPDNTDETHPPLRRPSLSEHVSYLPPPAYPNHNISPSDGTPVDCGMMPSYLYSSNQRPSRHRIPSPREPEQGKVGEGESRMRVEWVVPFSYDSHPSNAYQQNPGGCPDRVHSVIHDIETRGASPHISPPSSSSSSSGYGSHLHLPANAHHAIPSSTKPPPQEDRLFNVHGWVEYLLPDERLYYVHQCYQVVIDMDLNDERLLDAVMAYLEDHCDAIPPGKELWLRDTGFHEGKFVPLRWLVDHSKQLMAFNPLHEANNGGSECHRPQYECEDDRLDAKYRYWSFMESHPAHTSLPLDAHQKAMDVLSWASTSELLPPSHSIPTPFTQEECQRLTALLQSISKQGETPLRTNTVSKILLRAICRHQSHFRPDKPLPVDAGRDGLRREGHSTPARSSKFMLTVGVHACLAAVVALYPSKTFVKVAGIGALLFSLSSVVSNAVTTAEFKAVAFHVRRAMLMFSLKDRTVADSRPPQNGWVSDRWDRGRTWRPLASMRLVNQLRLLAVVLKFKLSRWLHRVPFIYWLLRLRGAEMTTVDC